MHSPLGVTDITNLSWVNQFFYVDGLTAVVKVSPIDSTCLLKVTNLCDTNTNVQFVVSDSPNTYRTSVYWAGPPIQPQTQYLVVRPGEYCWWAFGINDELLPGGGTVQFTNMSSNQPVTGSFSITISTGFFEE